MKSHPETLKEAVYKTIHRNKKSVPQIAEEVGMSPGYLAKAALPDEDMLGKDNPMATGCRLPAKKIVPIVRATDDYSILDVMEYQVGRVAIKLPEAIPNLKTVQLNALKAASEFGGLMREVEMSCADGVLTEREKERICKEGWEAIEAIMQIVKGCEE